MGLKTKILLAPFFTYAFVELLYHAYYFLWITKVSILGFTTLSKCYGKLGCVNVTQEWYHTMYRPFNVLPLDRHVVNTNFVLFTKDGPEMGESVTAEDPNTIITSHFDVNNPIVFIVHGLFDTGNSPWLTILAKSILKYKGPANVFKVDWGGGSFPPYFLASANARLVGLEMGYFGTMLITKFGAKASNMHIIGHSLGAHIASYTADKIPGIGIITGLDPAGLYYHHDMPLSTRLDHTDAKFVQAIHTDGSPFWQLGYGYKERCGHVDFYPNSGERQPGCELTSILTKITETGLLGFLRTLFACSHVRSIDLYIDSFMPGASYVGYECTDYDTFSKGQCFDCGEDNSRCAKMGWNAANYAKTGRKEVSMYFVTGKQASYSKYHYHVKVQLANISNAPEYIRGQLTLTLHGTQETIHNQFLTPDSDAFYHGKIHEFLFVSDIDVGQVKSSELLWNHKQDIFEKMFIPVFFLNHLHVSKMEVSIVRHCPELELRKFTFQLAPGDGRSHATISNGHFQTLRIV